jgi:hypothetical protein
MELKTARLTLLIDPNKKAAFERLCALQDRTASQVVRQLIRDYLAAHGVEYAAAGPEEAPTVNTEPLRSTARRPQPKSTAASSSRTGRQRG